ncbi:MAG: hypothetical protein HeimC3_50220 [Candidatus Heimdallarchaeota archaeon LC_3]|nr:MAG: hypothetical protein HeimC3_50220 [Candidatus Heimdallarchaeota archaeon LC_3]
MVIYKPQNYRFMFFDIKMYNYFIQIYNGYEFKIINPIDSASFAICTIQLDLVNLKQELANEDILKQIKSEIRFIEGKVTNSEDIYEKKYLTSLLLIARYLIGTLNIWNFILQLDLFNTTLMTSWGKLSLKLVSFDPLHIQSILGAMKEYRYFFSNKTRIELAKDFITSAISIIKIRRVPELDYLLSFLAELKTIDSADSIIKKVEKYAFFNWSNYLEDIKLNLISPSHHDYRLMMFNFEYDELQFRKILRIFWDAPNNEKSGIFQGIMHVISTSKKNIRKTPSLIGLVSKLLIDRLNFYIFYQISPRRNYAVKFSKYPIIVNQLLDIRENDLFIEFFSNIPIISYLSAFLGAKCVSIDRDYNFEVDDIKKFSDKLLAAKSRSERNLITINFVNRPIGSRIKKSLKKDSINPKFPFIVGPLSWFANLIEEIPQFHKLDVLNDDILSFLGEKKFNKIYLDPPLNIKTVLQREDHVITLLSKVLTITREIKKKKSIIVLRLPKDIPEEKKDKLIELIKKEGFKLDPTFINDHFYLV